MHSHLTTKIWCANHHHQSYVPLSSDSIKKISVYFITILALLITTGIIEVQAHEGWQREHDQEHYGTRIQPDTSFHDALRHRFLAAPSGRNTHKEYKSIDRLRSDEPTPPLTNSFSRFRTRRHDNDDVSSPETEDHAAALVWPQRSIRIQRSPVAQAGSPELNFITPVFGGFSPVENTQLALPQQDDSDVYNSQADASNNLDVVEQGSGSGWPDGIPFPGAEEMTTLVDPSMVSSVAAPASGLSPLSTPVFEPLPNSVVGDSSPMLMRRLPKLIATSGSTWQYTIPPDTFQDEDGDMRQLKSYLTLKMQPSGDASNTIGNNQGEGVQSRWLEYDQSTRTLYGFPTDDNVGRHEYFLHALDRWNNTNNETVDITVRRHQSSRAFTHSINVGVEFVAQRRSSLPEMLSELVKFISEGVYNDPNEDNMVLHGYKLVEGARQPPEQSPRSLSITWSNSSLPVHPCDLFAIESVFKLLVDDRYLTSGWSLQTQGSSELAPSRTLMKALSPDFKPSSVSINLQGSCESRRSSLENAIRGPNPLDTEPRIKNRIGKLRWKLGQPIIYNIPDDVFTLGDGSKVTNNLSLALHTIDGKTLEQDPSYKFLEFDQDKRTIFGLPYDLTTHVGQRELLLTARNSVTNQLARETFVIDIEPQDLTTINNRAFQMSLYFLVRANAFGPRDKVQVGRRMISALQIGDLNYDHDQDRPGFTVIDVQQFSVSSSIESSTALSDPANSWKYHEKIFLVNDAASASDHHSAINTEGTTFYKFTWTNETIGHGGECPVEVIKENILYALERSMLDYIPPNIDQRVDDNKNDSVRFYERLRSYFEPELDLIHLRFEPLGACVEALELHDVGNSEVADGADKAAVESDGLGTEPQPAPTPHIRSTEVMPKAKDISPVNSDEYWAIVVLIILVVAIIFVVMMLFMGLHTYRINQEKRFELQLKLAQARQNSMYLSSMMLADQSYAGDMMSRHAAIAKPVYVDERSSRKPVILDTEKQLLTNGNSTSVPMYKPTSVHLAGDSVQTMPLRQNTTFTMDSISDMQNGANTMIANQQMFANGRNQSMTLNRRAVGAQAVRPMGRQTSMSQLSQSQSILTVASIGSQGPYIPNTQAMVPFIYAPMPVLYETSGAGMPHEL